MRPVEKDPAVRGWFDERRVLVVGLGKSGTAAAHLLSRLGARVAVTDKRSKAECRHELRSLPRGTEIENGAHGLLSRPWDLLVVSPGVPSSVCRVPRARGVPVWGELELAYRVLSLAGRWPTWSAAITGTNGKTTTTAMLGSIFRASGRPTIVAGNIGVPLSAVINEVTRRTALALEVSSYQLETASAFRPAVGAVLNVTPDHLARHGSMDAYAAAKFRLFQSQGPSDAVVLNARDPWCRRGARSVTGQVYWFGGRRPGSGLTWDGKWIRGSARADQWIPPPLPGRHNIDNALAAVACAQALGVSHAAIARGLAAFRGVEHRLELVRTWRGIRFFNDSKATNVDSTRVALASLPKPLTVILGGQDKGAPYAPLLPLLRAKAKNVLLIGEASEKIQRELAGRVSLTRCDTLARAVDRAAHSAQSGESVLLSPACASFDQFDNFEHRGRCFKELVGAL